MKENLKWLIIGLTVIVCVWIHAWSTRYEWSSTVPYVLDRWSGHAYPGGIHSNP